MGHALVKVDRKCLDLFWMLLGYLFYVHASSVRADHDRPLGFPVQKKRKVYLSINVNPLMHKNCIYLQPFWACLMSDEVVPDHLFREGCNLRWSLNDLDSSLQSAGQFSLASSASLNLTLEDKTSFVAQSLGNSFSFKSCRCYLTLLHIDPMISHELL